MNYCEFTSTTYDPKRAGARAVKSFQSADYSVNVCVHAGLGSDRGGTSVGSNNAHYVYKVMAMRKKIHTFHRAVISNLDAY